MAQKDPANHGKATGGRLWDKGLKLDEAVHKFTVGTDPIVDLEIARWDVLASAAHARMLAKIGILKDSDLKGLIHGLRKINAQIAAGEFEISEELEDCHTTIESKLTELCGDAGLRIHTGRSRNDQVLVAMRLYLRHQLSFICEELLATAHLFLDKCSEHRTLEMPGYTHFQAAMPTSVGIWYQAFCENAIELIFDGLRLHELTNRNPLGVASGFGVPLKLDRDYTTQLLGFASTQRNPIDVANSRGRIELKFLRWCSDIASCVEKFACDVVLFSTREFGFFKLPDEFTTGSSIMPQKKNPDVAELLRARAGKLRSCETELSWVIAKLPSSYHRDHQLTKEPVIRAVREIREILPIFGAVAKGMSFNRDALAKAMDIEVYATYEVYREVAKDQPFREAYRNVAKKISGGEIAIEVLKKDFNSIVEISEQETKKAISDLEIQSQKLLEIRTKEDAAIASVLAGES